MSFLSYFLGQKKKQPPPSSAEVARERLQLILTRERSNNSPAPDYLPQLQKELIAVISKFLEIKPEDIHISLEQQDSLEVLEVKIEMPQGEAAAVVRPSVATAESSTSTTPSQP